MLLCAWCASGRLNVLKASAYTVCLQARLQAEVERAAAAEARLGLVLAAVERCQTADADLDELADAYGALQVCRRLHGIAAYMSAPSSWTRCTAVVVMAFLRY